TRREVLRDHRPTGEDDGDPLVESPPERTRDQQVVPSVAVAVEQRADNLKGRSLDQSIEGCSVVGVILLVGSVGSSGKGTKFRPVEAIFSGVDDESHGESTGGIVEEPTVVMDPEVGCREPLVGVVEGEGSGSEGLAGGGTEDIVAV